MTACEPATAYRQAEHHRFAVGASEFLYLVPSGAVFTLDGLSKEIFESLAANSRERRELIGALSTRGHAVSDVEASINEMHYYDVLASGDVKPKFPAMPGGDFPLQRLVLNVTNQCNLSCGYCYEYSEDKIAITKDKPKHMTDPVAQAAIDMLFKESAGRPKLHMTFFGGESLLNFELMQSAVAYADAKAAHERRFVDYSLTTNATLLTEEIADFLAEHKFGVTVSIDGDRELHDRMRVFHNGKGSYDIIAPKIKMLLKRHRTNSIGARVTLSAGVSHVRRIFDHLTQEFGFDGVGFSPATANPDRLYHIGGEKMDDVLGQFAELAYEYRDFALQNRHHRFTNISDTLKELHSGVSKAYTCGAGLGMLGVGTSGDIGACHRFVDAPVAQMGNVMTHGLNHEARREFLEQHHIGARPDCHTCWVRPVCAGGCYHESFIHHGSTQASLLKSCDRIRGWIDLCLHIYAEIGLVNPKFLERFND